MKRCVCLGLVMMMLLSAGCKGNGSEELTKGLQSGDVELVSDMEEYHESVTDFAVHLFQKGLKAEENTLISPLSVMSALAMTANGADGETLKQMETVLGISDEELNRFFYTYLTQLPETEKSKLQLANSIWFTDDEKLEVKEEFLQVNADYYGAEIYKTPFTEDTCNDINFWVDEKTMKMIPKIIDSIPENSIMYLINALAFEAEWMEIYEEHQVRDAEFTKEDGSKQNVDMMYSREDYYLEDTYATGFVKYYEGQNYAFAALLPKEGVAVETCVNALTGEGLHDMLEHAQKVPVDAGIPKFETEYSIELKEVLRALGMEDMFSEEKANFDRLGSYTNGNIFIDQVLHKTFISVAEKGTKAGAVTAVSAKATGAIMMPEEPKKVILDRPFIYMLIDCENNLPFFIGTLMDVAE